MALVINWLKHWMNLIFLKWLIATAVVGITLWLTMRNSDSSQDWAAVFLAVIGYYFKDRTTESHAIGNSNPSLEAEVMQETTWQFALALILVVSTPAAFAFPQFKPKISGVWIGAVVLALGFYFKRIGIPNVERWHDRFRAILAILLTLLTFPLLWRITRSQAPFELPLQWVGLVFIVITFYFKEKNAERELVTDASPSVESPALTEADKP
jgi:hypothetical protein